MNLITRERAAELLKMMKFLQEPDIGFEGFAITTWSIFLDGIKCTVYCSTDKFAYQEEQVE